MSLLLMQFSFPASGYFFSRKLVDGRIVCKLINIKKSVGILTVMDGWWAVVKVAVNLRVTQKR